MKKFSELFNDEEKKKLKPLIFLAFLCIASLVFIAVMPLGNKKETAKNTEIKSETASIEKQKEDLETKLTNILSKIDGAGDVETMITFASSEEIVPAYNSNTTREVTKEEDSSGGQRTTTNSTENKTMITSNSNEPIVLKTSEAEVKGVIVVATGANNPEVKKLLYEAVQTSLQISGHQVEVYAK